jgi:hypothetical protein
VKDVAVKSYGDTTVISFAEEPPTPDQPPSTAKFVDDPLTASIIKEYSFTETITKDKTPEITKPLQTVVVPPVETKEDSVLGKPVTNYTFSHSIPV